MQNTRDGKIPYRHIVTIDADRHSFGGVTGTIIKGFLGGVLSADNGAAPSPSESPRYFAATLDESTIVGYYTLKKCRSPNRNPKFTADIQQKGAIWQETTGLTVPLQETVI